MSSFSKTFDLGLRAFHDTKMPGHLFDVANLYVRILPCSVFANGKTGECLPSKGHDPVVRALLAGMPWGAVVKHCPNVGQGYGP